MALLGQGTYGVVLQAMYRGVLVAAKLLPRGEALGKAERFVRREILFQASLRHPQIIRVHEVFNLPDHLVIVMEVRSWLLAACAIRCWVSVTNVHHFAGQAPSVRSLSALVLGQRADGGNLLQHVLQRGGPLPEHEARHLFQQLVAGVDACHRLVRPLHAVLCDALHTPCLQLFTLARERVRGSAPDEARFGTGGVLCEHMRGRNARFADDSTDRAQAPLQLARRNADVCRAWRAEISSLKICC